MKKKKFLTMNDSLQKMTVATNILQLAVLVLGVGAVFFTFGSRDQQLQEATSEITELRGIAEDLVKAQVFSSAKDSEHDRILEQLSIRLSRLESK